MRDEWYSDKRDLVKWAVLMQLAQMYEATSILQVAYYRPTAWKDKPIEIDGRAYPVPPEVLGHFRNINNIGAIRPPPQLKVLDALFSDRDAYPECVLTAIRTLPERAIIFLDPDTGLEPPKSRADLKHVLETELCEIWHALRRGDLLVLYQHQTNMAGRPWVEEKQTQFETAIGLEPGGSKLAQGREIARDVAFFFSQRLDSSKTAQAAE